MPMDRVWKAQVLQFLKKAGDDLKRVGEDIKTETTRLMEEIRDPEKQQKAREKLSELGTWAKKTAEEAATMAESAMRKVEDGLSTAGDYVAETVAPTGKGEPVTPRTEKTAAAEPAPAAKKPARKTVGRKAGGKPAAAAKAPAKKTVGRKKPRSR